MASHRISGQRWPDGTAVEVYPAEAQTSGSNGRPAGLSVTAGSVNGGILDLEGLTIGRRYLAYAAGVSVGFLVPKNSPTDSLRSRVDELEGDVEALGSGSGGGGGGGGGGSTTIVLGETQVETGVWKELPDPGPGGRATALIVSPFDSNRVLVSGDMLGIGLSTDGGLSWQATFGLQSYEMGSFAWHPTDPQEVWCGSMGGIVKSTDGGKTWAPSRAGMPPQQGYPYSAPIETILFDPADERHMLAFGGSKRRWIAAGVGVENYGVVWESIDGGDTWAQKSTIVADTNILNVTHVGGSLDVLVATVLSLGVYRSTDGGATWAAANTGLPHLGVGDVAYDPARGVVLALKNSPAAVGGLFLAGGVYHSIDAGVSWAPLGTGFPAVTATPFTSATRIEGVGLDSNGDIYVADINFVGGRKWKLRAGTSLWTVLPETPRAMPALDSPYVWAVDPAVPGVVYGATSDTLIKTSDGGATWKDVSSEIVGDAIRGRGFSGQLAMSLAFGAKAGELLTTGFDAAHLGVSQEGVLWKFPTRAWDNYNGGQDVRWATDRIAYAILGQQNRFNGLAVTTDGGVSWSVKAGAPLMAKGATSLAAQGYGVCPINLSGSQAIAVLPNGVVYRTLDTGATWASLFTTSPARWVECAPDFSAIYVCTDGGVYKSVNGGGSWALMASSPNLTRLRCDPHNPERLYGCGWRLGSVGLWRFDGTWTKIVDDSFVSDIAVDPLDATHLVYCTSDLPYHDIDFATGVWRSIDQGHSWDAINDGLPMLRVVTVAFDPWTPGRLVAGTYGRGFFDIQLPDADPGVLTPLPAQAALRAPYATRILGIAGAASPAPTVDLTLDIRRNGSGVFADPLDRPRIEAGQGSSLEKQPFGVDLEPGDVLTVDPLEPPVGSSAVTYVAKTNVVNTDGHTLSYARPAGSAVNDIHVLAVSAYVDGVDDEYEITVPAGWHPLATRGSTAVRVDYFWRRDTGAGGWPYVFDLAPSALTWKYVGTVFTLRGIPTTVSPADAIRTVYNGYGTSLTIPDFGVPTTGDKVFALIVTSAAATFAAQAGYTTRGGVTSSSQFHLLEKTSNASEGVLPGWSGTLSADAFKIGILLAFRGVERVVYDRAAVTANVRLRPNGDAASDPAALPDLSGLLPLSQKGLPNGYAGLDEDGLVPPAQLPVASGAQPISEKGQPSGYASLDSGGLVPTSQLPVAAGAQPLSEKGDPNGYAGLDGAGKVPLAQLPALGGGVSAATLRLEAALSTRDFSRPDKVMTDPPVSSVGTMAWAGSKQQWGGATVTQAADGSWSAAFAVSAPGAGLVNPSGQLPAQMRVLGAGYLQTYTTPSANVAVQAAINTEQTNHFTLQNVHRYSFWTDAVQLAVLAYSRGGDFRWLVDGEYVSLATTSTSDGTNNSLELDFTLHGGSKMRHIQLEIAYGLYPYGLRIGPIDTLMAGPFRKQPQMMWIADSFGANPGFIGYPVMVSRILGFECIPDALGGTGYLKENGAAGTPAWQNFVDRVPLHMGAGKVIPEYVGIYGSVNDEIYTTTQVHDAAVTLLASIASAAPDARVFGGIFGKNDSDNANLNARAAVLQTAFEAAPNGGAGSFRNFVGALTGTGHVGGLAGFGDRDRMLKLDDTHPVDIEGQRYIARLVANHLLEVL